MVLHLTDSYVLTQPSTYISALLLALRSMLQMDLPHLNVLTKIDNLANYPNLPFNLDFYTEVHSLSYLLPHLATEQTSRSISTPAKSTSKEANGNVGGDVADDVPTSKFAALNQAIIDLVEDYSLVGFETLAVEDKKSMMILLRAIDRAGGYAFGSAEGANDTVWQIAMRQDAVTMDARDVQERWLDRREEMDEEERREWEEEVKALKEVPEDEGSVAEKAGGSGKKHGGGGSDDDEEDLEEIEKIKTAMKDSGIKIIRKG